MGYRIFLSHSTQDRAWCEWLQSAATKMAMTTYLAEHDLRPGRPLADKVRTQIVASDAVVVLLSHNSANAPYVHQEIGCAIQAGKVVIPLVQPGVSRDSLAMLNGVEYIPFDFERPEAGRDKLVQALVRLSQQQRPQAVERTVQAVLTCLALVLLAINSR
jgi:hypothetical protein